MTRISILLGVIAVVCGLGAETPSIGNVSLRHGGRVVTVDYTLAHGPAIVTAEFATNGVPVDSGWPFSMPGDVARVVTNEVCRFCWTLDLGNPGLVADELSVMLKAWPLETPPDYLVVDFAKATNVLYFASEATLPGGIGNLAFRTNAIVMKRIPVSSSEWRMGVDSSYPYQGNASWEVPHYVKMTKDYYIGVFPLTQGQFRHFQGASTPASAQSVENGYPDGDLKPLTAYNFNDVRGTANWPSEGHAVKANTFIGKLRARTGIEFDFPTEVQWAYACRAGTSTWHYNGNDTATLDEIAWYNDNVAQGYDTKQMHPVGLKKPNAFGIYDMIGNCYEFVLDWFVQDLSPAEFYLDSVGPTNGTERVTRSGNWSQVASSQNSCYRRKCPPNSGSVNNGFRLACPCPALAN